MPPIDEFTKDLRHIFAYISKDANAIDEANYSINFVVTTNRVDRDNEIVMPEAIVEAIKRPGEFVENPAALPCHLHRLDNGMPPSVGSWDPETVKAFVDHAEMRLNFAKGTILGEEYWLYYSKRHMRAISIGFRIIEGHEEVRDGKRIYIITKIELYEISCVAVGANPQALSKIKSLFEKFYTDDTGESPESLGKEKSAPLATLQQRMDELQEGIDEIKSLLTPDSDEMAEKFLRGELDSDNSVSAGDEKEQAARLLNVFKKAVNSLDLKGKKNAPLNR